MSLVWNCSKINNRFNGIQYDDTACFFSTETKDDGVIQSPDLTDLHSDYFELSDFLKYQILQNQLFASFLDFKNFVFEIPWKKIECGELMIKTGEFCSPIFTLICCTKMMISSKLPEQFGWNLRAVILA